MGTKQSLSRTYFIAGLVIGLCIALVYNYLNNDNQPSDKVLVNKASAVEEAPLTTKKINKKKKKKSKKKISPVKVDSLSIDSLANDSNLLLLDSNKIDSLILSDSLFLDSLLLDSFSLESQYDSLMFPENDSLEFKALQIDNSSYSDIKVSQDELIFAMIAYPKGIKGNFDCATNEKLDSVLVNNIHKNKKEGLYVEFWQSPLNYKGYRLSKSTLILYGLYEYTAINLKYTEDGFIELIYKEKTYYLQCTDDFKTL